MVREGPNELGRDRGTAAIEVEALKSLEPCQRLQVRDVLAVRQVEALKSLEPCQRLQVRDLLAVKQVEALKRLEPCQRLQVCDILAAIEAETLKSLEPCQRLQVRDAPAGKEVEALKSLEPCQCCQIRERRGFSNAGPFKFPCLGEPDLAQAECLEVREVSQAGRQLAQLQIAEVQALGPGFPSLLDPPLRLTQVLLHDGCILPAGRPRARLPWDRWRLAGLSG